MKHEGNEASEAARALSKLGAPKGGQARADKLSPGRRRQIAQAAARARWQKQRGKDDPVTAVQEDETVRAKWAIDGATTLAEAAAKARAFADELQRLHDEGYVLREPVEDDYGFYYKP